MTKDFLDYLVGSISIGNGNRFLLNKKISLMAVFLVYYCIY